MYENESESESEEENQLEKLGKLKEETSSRTKPHQISLAEVEQSFGDSESPTASQSGKEKISPAQGKLKVFLGAAAGVGKTYAMLEEAQVLKAQGVDVVVGYVELHGRRDTEKLVEGLEVVPRRKANYRSTILEEMDTAAIITRRPQVALVDELAHSNAAGSTFSKRYEDIEAILAAGINVYTTVNIQHLESLNDRVYELTKTRVRETFPDRLFDLAAEVVLIDLPPEDLRERIRQGKVYHPEKVNQALTNFFKTGNLLVLRELALRETADAIKTSAPHREYRALHEEEPPNANPFVLICVALKPQDTRLIRQGWRFAHRLKAPAEVITVLRSDVRKIEEEELLIPLRRLARTLELPFNELKGEPVEEIVKMAKAKHASLIVMGESTRNTWLERFFGTFTDKILRSIDGIDIYIVGDREFHRKK